MRNGGPPVGVEERLHVDDQVLEHRQALDRLDRDRVAAPARSSISTLQASRLTPLMRMASEPQTPCAHERRNASEPSRFHFTSCSASSSRSPGSTGTS